MGRAGVTGNWAVRDTFQVQSEAPGLKRKRVLQCAPPVHVDRDVLGLQDFKQTSFLRTVSQASGPSVRPQNSGAALVILSSVCRGRQL